MDLQHGRHEPVLYSINSDACSGAHLGDGSHGGTRPALKFCMAGATQSINGAEILTFALTL
jgi:hypothetical protein